MATRAMLEHDRRNVSGESQSAGWPGGPDHRNSSRRNRAQAEYDQPFARTLAVVGFRPAFRPVRFWSVPSCLLHFAFGIRQPSMVRQANRRQGALPVFNPANLLSAQTPCLPGVGHSFNNLLRDENDEASSIGQNTCQTLFKDA